MACGKKHFCKQNIENYRPICLTNVDYRSLAFTLAQKMHKIKHKYYIKGNKVHHYCKFMEFFMAIGYSKAPMAADEQRLNLFVCPL